MVLGRCTCAKNKLQFAALGPKTVRKNQSSIFLACFVCKLQAHTAHRGIVQRRGLRSRVRLAVQPSLTAATTHHTGGVITPLWVTRNGGEQPPPWVCTRSEAVYAHRPGLTLSDGRERGSVPGRTVPRPLRLTLNSAEAGLRLASRAHPGDRPSQSTPPPPPPPSHVLHVRYGVACRTRT